MENKSLWERCKISTNNDEDSFVGMRIDQKDIKITFPLGYNCQNAEDKVIRKEILSLLHLLQKFSSKKSNDNNISRKEDKLDFPILSYQHLILDYFNNGYYTEKEIEYASAKKGKINWKRTIQKKQPYMSESNIVYLDFIVKRNITNNNTLLTRIHEFCVYESFLKLGWLYTDTLPMKPRIKFNRKMFVSILNDALSKTFNDNKKQLFCAMLNIINNVSEGNSISSDSSFGTTSFEYIWEKMIDYVFGEDNKEIYFPRARWTLLGNAQSIESSSLQPDTIIKLGNTVYIIDAKYYKYGVTGNPIHLPASSSIQKQITYGEYVASSKFKELSGQAYPFDAIYNAFVMPYNKMKKNENDYKFIGTATADWKSDDKIYENVVGLLLDTKHLMDNCYRQNGVEIEKISTNIQKTFDN